MPLLLVVVLLRMARQLDAEGSVSALAPPSETYLSMPCAVMQAAPASNISQDMQS